jgi:hypothetical protein
MSASVSLGELQLRQRTLTDVALEGAVEAGALSVQRLQFKSSHGEAFQGRLELRPSEVGAEVLMTVVGSGLTIGLPATTEEEVRTLPRYEVDTLLHGQGKTLSEIAASLDGYGRLVMGPGALKTGAMKLFTQDFLSTVLGAINPFVKSDPYNHYECAVLLARIDNGVLSGKPAAIVQGKKLRIVANAAVDLKTEELDIQIQTIPRKGLGLSVSDLVNPYTRIGGTLASPSLALNPQGVLLEGGAAVATGGLSILAKRFQQRFLSSKDPCGDALADADPAFSAIRAQYLPESASSP